MANLLLLTVCLCLSIIGGGSASTSASESEPETGLQGGEPVRSAGSFWELRRHFPYMKPRIDTVSSNPENAQTFWVSSTMASLALTAIAVFVLYNAIGVGAVVGIVVGAHLVGLGIMALIMLVLKALRIRRQRDLAAAVKDDLWYRHHYFSPPGKEPALLEWHRAEARINTESIDEVRTNVHSDIHSTDRQGVQARRGPTISSLNHGEMFKRGLGDKEKSRP
ncbi:hypothetical protein SeLEV6574_g08236 [Synchytrium endobioticum]|uniref:Uncharacterized protein n=1 Tax=Synchytrium endobioticum TaxID=286115 RepID=A0A507CAE4_9FUNG|nr:hypothetical protein SeLEV6574_g08236 [Synchytrium endobioticum]